MEVNSRYYTYEVYGNPTLANAGSAITNWTPKGRQNLGRGDSAIPLELGGERQMRESKTRVAGDLSIATTPTDTIFVFGTPRTRFGMQDDRERARAENKTMGTGTSGFYKQVTPDGV